MGSATCGLTLWFCDGDHMKIVLVVRNVEINSDCLGLLTGYWDPVTFVTTSQDNTASFLSGYLGSTNPLEATFILLEIQLSEENSGGLYLSMIHSKCSPNWGQSQCFRPHPEKPQKADHW